MAQRIRMGIGLLTLIVMGASPVLAAMPAHKAVQYGDPALAFSSGFIGGDVPADGVVAKTAYNRQVMGHGDTVYLRMKHPEDVSVGSLYTVYRQTRKVFHPVNGRYLGNLFSIVGIVQITKMDQDLATATVDRGFMWIAPGDAVMPFALPAAEEPGSEPGLLDTSGVVVELQTPRTLVAQNNIVYLDLGRVDGLRAGDRLSVLRSRRGFPTEPIGEIRVLAVEDVTAAAVIVHAVMPVAIGDQVVPKDSTRESAIEGIQNVRIRTSPVSPSTKTRDTLAKSLHAEIAKGDVSIEQVGDKVTISLNDLVDQLEYEPGQAQIKPTGLKVLKQISDYLKNDTENDILVEGHTDNQRIGPSLLKYYPTNQELSEARAGLIVRYFIEAGLDPNALTAIGYADTRPVRSNVSEEGRKRNRRIEIVLTPKTADMPQEESAAPEAPASDAKPVDDGKTATDMKQAEPPSIEKEGAELEPIEPLHVNVPKSPDTAAPETAASSGPQPSTPN